jgi:hypothetical protein
MRAVISIKELVLHLNKVISIFIFSILFSNSAIAGNIGYGKLVGVKVFGSDNNRLTKIFFDVSADKLDTPCLRAATITHSLHEPEEIQQMLSVALAGYMSGKRVRAYSYTDGSCEADMVSVQDTYF